MNNVMECVLLHHKLQSILPKFALVNHIQIFITPHLVYGIAIYDPPLNLSFLSRTESVQHDWTLTITGAIKDCSLENLY